MPQETKGMEGSKEDMEAEAEMRWKADFQQDLESGV